MWHLGVNICHVPLLGLDLGHVAHMLGLELHHLG
jgi:hypothetical protein